MSAIASIWAGLLSEGLGIIRKLVPDKDLAKKLEAEFELFFTGRVFEVVMGQLRINEKEAEHSSIFVAGWRPFIGWVCGTALVWNFIAQPLMVWGLFAFNPDLMVLDPETGAQRPLPPELEIGELVTILLGMLGLSGMRTYEKRVGIERNTIKEPGEEKPKRRWWQRRGGE